MTGILLSIAAGLVLFLYAVNNLSDTIRDALGNRSRYLIERFTGNTLYSLLTGIFITILLDSSSAVIIITIVLVNSGALRLRQAMGIVLGANIGTTFSSQLIALDIGRYSPVLLILGFILLLVAKSGPFSKTGRIILYFGVLFYGLHTMERAVEPLKEVPTFIQWLAKTENPFTGTLIGAFVTLVIQSSSATVGMAIILTKKGILSLSGSIAVMLGAELGTCSDTLLATIGGSRQAIKTGLFHLAFNLGSIGAGLIFFEPFVTLVRKIGQFQPPEKSVANAHMLFNMLGVLIFVWGIPLYERWLNRWLPDKRINV